ncbi:hypothetical protein [Flavobacterium beibuense]|uniref:Lipoprotein n=1 Tax=Flavobacterium beibuense TaxID=657326 RepID=A0A444WDL0_9FLAO|nr:hypothetical protein [Flavobacterium beibuense]RYJ43941.1 hypothetical protein NU09_1449 [Flavobacterium beibuense]
MKNIYFFAVLLLLFGCTTEETNKIIQDQTILKSNQNMESDCDPCTLLKAEINATYNEQLMWYIENNPSPSAQAMIDLHIERMNYLDSYCEETGDNTNCDSCTLLKAEINATYNEQLMWYIENNPSPSAQAMIDLHIERMNYLDSYCD